MDYTLAQYRPDTFESLAYRETVKKLVYSLKYPDELLLWNFDWRYMVRGLVLDKKRGNILKVPLCICSYPSAALVPLLLLPLFPSLVRSFFPAPHSSFRTSLFPLMCYCLECYAAMYRDVRAAVDLCHRDGTLKNAVANDPARYITRDDELVDMLQMLRDSGRKTFLVTNRRLAASLPSSAASMTHPHGLVPPLHLYFPPSSSAWCFFRCPLPAAHPPTPASLCLLFRSSPLLPFPIPLHRYTLLLHSCIVLPVRFNVHIRFESHIFPHSLPSTSNRLFPCTPAWQSLRLHACGDELSGGKILWDYTHVVMNYLVGTGQLQASELTSLSPPMSVTTVPCAPPHTLAHGSLWDYTHVVMNYLIYEVDIRSGMLFNTDNGSPMAQVGGMGDTRAVAQRAEHSQACRVFQGGNVGHLHHMLHIAAGAQVMYVGDHIFGDILRSKKSLGTLL
ncbi:unnamed protein product [Closterium sp. NIES-54]